MQRTPRPKRARLEASKRVQGGTAGILAAIEADRLDAVEPPSWRLLTNAEKRAKRLREHRQIRARAKRAPF